MINYRWYIIDDKLRCQPMAICSPVMPPSGDVPTFSLTLVHWPDVAVAVNVMCGVVLNSLSWHTDRLSLLRSDELERERER